MISCELKDEETASVSRGAACVQYLLHQGTRLLLLIYRKLFA